MGLKNKLYHNRLEVKMKLKVKMEMEEVAYCYFILLASFQFHKNISVQEKSSPERVQKIINLSGIHLSLYQSFCKKFTVL